MNETKTKSYCHDCKRPVVNRLVDHCLYCGVNLESNMVLTSDEKARLRKKEMRELDARRKARIERDEEHLNFLGTGADDSSDEVWSTLGLFGVMDLMD